MYFTLNGFFAYKFHARHAEFCIFAPSKACTHFIIFLNSENPNTTCSEKYLRKKVKNSVNYFLNTEFLLKQSSFLEKLFFSHISYTINP